MALNFQRISGLNNYLRIFQATSKFSTNTSLRILSSDKKCLYCPCTQFYKHDSTLPKVRYISSIDSKSLAKGESILEKLISKIPFINPEKNRIDLLGYLLYESIADGIDYVKFFEEFKLSDTFYSWFVITELHIWMVIVRCMAEGDVGPKIRNKIVEALWADVRQRVKQIGEINPSGMRYQIQELSEQFQAALIAYDEGLQTNDAVLAAALWRRMYQYNEVDAENLEKLVKYIRKQMCKLDKLNSDFLFKKGSIIWDSYTRK